MSTTDLQDEPMLREPDSISDNPFKVINLTLTPNETRALKGEKMMQRYLKNQRKMAR